MNIYLGTFNHLCVITCSVCFSSYFPKWYIIQHCVHFLFRNLNSHQVRLNYSAKIKTTFSLACSNKNTYKQKFYYPLIPSFLSSNSHIFFFFYFIFLFLKDVRQKVQKDFSRNNYARHGRHRSWFLINSLHERKKVIMK